MIKDEKAFRLWFRVRRFRPNYDSEVLKNKFDSNFLEFNFISHQIGISKDPKQLIFVACWQSRTGRKAQLFILSLSILSNLSKSDIWHNISVPVGHVLTSHCKSFIFFAFLLGILSFLATSQLSRKRLGGIAPHNSQGDFLIKPEVSISRRIFLLIAVYHYFILHLVCIFLNLDKTTWNYFSSWRSRIVLRNYPIADHDFI